METDKDLRPLAEEEIEEKLQDLPGWEYKDNKIQKEFTFPSFMAGLGLVNELAPFCNETDHHPDICIKYKKIVFELITFSAGEKLTERDFTVAKKIEDLYAKIS